MLAAESFVRSGKVRDLYEVGPDRLLLVASDRMSAFDVVLPTEIPDKGRVLTGLSRFWFDDTAAIVPNQVIATDPADLPGDRCASSLPWSRPSRGSSAWRSSTPASTTRATSPTSPR